MCNEQKNKPNILFVMTDQLNPFYTPPYGGKAVMPALQKLADTGTVFGNAYCNSPLCSPSRASMMSGQLISSLECAFDNANEFSCETPTFAHLFNSVGYHTVLAGKMHFIGPDQLHGFQERLTTDIYPADFSWTPPGWDLSAPSHPAYRKILLNNKIVETNIQLQYDEEVHQRAKEKLRQLSESEQPFFMTVSYTHPHSPFQITEQYQKIYKNSSIDLGDCAVPSDQDEYNEYLAWDMNFAVPLNEADIIRNRKNYLGMLSYIDNKLAELVETLNINGLAENTIIIFTSDHGEMLGKKGMWEKRTFLEDALRVPLIFSGPSIAQGVSREPVSLVDLFPTFIDLLKSDWTEEYLDGKSLINTLEGRTDSHSRDVINEYYGECIKYPFRSVIFNGYKLVHFPEHEQHDLIYSLKDDPDETCNVINDNNVFPVKEKLYTLLNKDFDYKRLKPIVKKSHRQRKLILEAEKMRVNKTDWNFYPPWEADGGLKYVR